MNRIGKKLLAAGLCLGLALGTVTGCGADTNAGKAVAVLDGENIDYSLVNFMLRFNQAEMQSAYGGLFGDNMWASYGENVKSDIMENVKQMLILEKHMEEYDVTITDEEKENIANTAAAFMESNEKGTLKAMTATQEIVERMLTLSLVQNKMQAAIVKDVDTEVSDEEAAQKKVQYVLFSTAATQDEEGNSVEKTDEEKAALKEQAEQLLEVVKGGTDMDEAVKAIDEEKSASTTTYGADNGSLDETVKAAVDSLSDGECADSVIETDSGYYVAKMVSTFDAEATENQKTTIVNQRKSDKFDEVYNPWEEAAEYTQDDELLAEMTFTDTFEVKSTETETEGGSEAETAAESEAASEAETAAESEAASETETAAESETSSETETVAE